MATAAKGGDRRRWPRATGTCYYCANQGVAPKEVRPISKRSLATAAVLALAVLANLYFWLGAPEGRDPFEDPGFVLSNLSLSYSEKMELALGQYFRYVRFVRESTPPEAVIILPPGRDPRDSFGSPALNYYFLRPRLVYPWAPKDLAKEQEVTHALFVPSQAAEADPEHEIESRFGQVGKKSYLPRSLIACLGDASFPDRGRTTKGAATRVLDFGAAKEPLLATAGEVPGVETRRHELARAEGVSAECLELRFTSPAEQRWLATVDLPVADGVTLTVTVKTTARQAVRAVAEVTFPGGARASVLSPPNERADTWETLLLKDPATRARELAGPSAAPEAPARLEAIGLEIAHPEVSKWGFVEVEAGNVR